jgi:predicted  nucleic acid-binding Zn-ribbon protein
MGPDIENLMRLQDADREIRRLQEEVAALPKRVALIEEKLAGHKAALEAAKAAVKTDEADRRKFETAIQDLRQKITKYRDQSLEVKTNDQYKALMHEIQFAEQDIRANEDKILDLMVNVETREQKVKVAEAELKAESAEVEKEKNEARERSAEDLKLLAEWNAKRETTRASINPDLIRHYERVMKFRGSGIAEVRDQKCTGCQTMLRPQTYNEVRSGKTIECESCQRILYFDPKREDPATKPVPTVKKRAKAKVTSGRAWFYRNDFDEAGEVFLAMANSEMRSSCRVYDAHSGRKIGITRNREGDFVTAFAHELGAGVQLRHAPSDKQLDEWGDELPSVILDELHSDVKAIQPATEAQPAAS